MSNMSGNPQLTVRMPRDKWVLINALARQSGKSVTVYIRDKLLDASATQAPHTLAHQASAAPLPALPIQDQRFQVAAPQNLDRVASQVEANAQRRRDARTAYQPDALPVETVAQPSLEAKPYTGLATSLRPAGRR